MSGKIPATWVQCEIGHVTDVVGGATPASKDVTNFTKEGGIPWLTPADLSGYRQMYIGRGSRNLTRKGFESCSATMIPSCSILFSSRAPVGYVAIAANPVCTSQGFKSFVLPNQLESRFVYYYLRFIKPIAESLATGTTFKELSGMGAGRLPLVVAPFNEQKRIADKLDAVLARVDACRERLDRVPAILKRFRQSVLAAATSGKLTEEWREEKGVGAEWSATSIQAVAQIGTGSTPLRSNQTFYSSTGTPWITSAATGKPIVMAADQFVTNSAIAAHRLRIYPVGTLLVAMYGEGKTRGQVTELGIAATINQACAAIVVNDDRAKRAFVKLLLQANYLEMRELAEGGNQPNLNLSKIREFPLYLPSLDEQDEIVRQVKALFAYADRLETRYAAARAQVERLTPVLLAKAFRGELVPQDPNDEPASVLLERIRAARAAIPPKPRSRQGAGRQTKTQKTEVLMLNRQHITDAHLCTILRERGPLTAEALWSASQLDIDDFYDQLRDEEARGLLSERRGDSPGAQRLLEAA